MRGANQSKASRGFSKNREIVLDALYSEQTWIFLPMRVIQRKTLDTTYLEPGNCYAGAALFQPSKTALARLRARLIDDPKELQDILADPEFKTDFPDGLVTRRELSALPDGVLGSDPAALYLKMVGLGCRKDVPDALLLEDDAIDLLIEIFRAARPLVCCFD